MTPLICPNDLSGALERGPDGRDRCRSGRRTSRRPSVGDQPGHVLPPSRYKHDQAHVKRLMEEGACDDRLVAWWALDDGGIWFGEL